MIERIVCWFLGHKWSIGEIDLCRYGCKDRYLICERCEKFQFEKLTYCVIDCPEHGSPSRRVKETK
jgi:hypothetical protein